MFDWVADPNAWAALATLTMLEIVLGIDNIIFITILTGKLPEEQQAKGRQIGLGLAMGMRILLLLSISWVMGLTAVLFDIGSALPFLESLEAFGSTARDAVGHAGEVVVGEDTNPLAITGRDLILLLGGAFLVFKATREIHHKLEGDVEHTTVQKAASSFGAIMLQIMALDLVFSLDSVITAVGMADDIVVMIIAVVVAVGVMMAGAGPISRFVQKHPSIKMLALAFLILIGVTLFMEGLNQHVSKGYIYSAMAFSLLVEFLNIRTSNKKKGTPPPVDLHDEPVLPPGTTAAV